MTQVKKTMNVKEFIQEKEVNKRVVELCNGKTSLQLLTKEEKQTINKHLEDLWIPLSDLDTFEDSYHCIVKYEDGENINLCYYWHEDNRLKITSNLVDDLKKHREYKIKVTHFIPISKD